MQMATRGQFHATFTRVMSLIMIVIGLALLIRTLTSGGGPLASGILLGLLFLIAGAARLYLQLRGS